MIPPPSNPLAGIRWLAVTNDSGEEMPAHAAVVVDSSGDEGQFVISKPTANSQHVWIAGPTPALDGDSATAVNTFPVDALYDDADGTPAVGQIWGAGAGSWKLRKGKTGFRVCGTPDTVKKVVQVERVSRGSMSSPADCSRYWLRLPDCATLTVTEALGACACLVAQTAALTKNASGALASEDLLYGCAPGVITTWCPSGAPRKWNLVVAGFTGGSTGFNHSYTLTYTTGETWTGTRSGITATLVQTADGSFTLTLNDGGGNTPSWTVTGVTDCCGDITLTLADADGTTTAPATLTVTPATDCGNGPSYTPYLEIVDGDCGPCRKLSWIPTAGSAVRTIPFEQVECGTDSTGANYIDFSSSDAALCTDDETACGENVVIVRVTCEVCDTTVSVSCCSGPMPAYLCVTLSNFTGMLDGFDDITVLVPYSEALGYYSYNFTPTPTATTSCSGGSETVTLLRVTVSPCLDIAGTKHWDVEVTGLHAATGITFGDNTETHTGDCALPVSGSISGPVETIVGCTATFDYDIADGTTNCAVTGSYICVEGVCTEVFDGSGSTLAECTAICAGTGTGTTNECCLSLLSGNTGSLVITGGASAGTYSVGWYASSSSCTSLYGFPSGVGCPFNWINWNPSATEFNATGPGVATVSTSHTCGPPVVIEFNDAAFLASIGASDVTLTT